MNTMKFILYARKSTDSEDKQVQSLEDQLSKMRHMATAYDYDIVATLQESRSAKRPNNRAVFETMIDMIEHGEANAILCWQFNRLSRNPTDSGRLQQLLQDGKLQLIQTNDRSYTPEDNALLLSVEAGMSNQYVLDLMKNVRRGMHSKADKGWFPNRPPIGYTNDRINKTIIVDDERSELVRRLWDLMLTDTYSVAEITRYAEHNLGLKSIRRKRSGGRPLSYSGVLAMFRNPFYMGMMRYTGLKSGNHIPLVTEEEFNKVQSIIDPKFTTRPKDVEYAFLFRGLLKCSDCGFSIVTTRKTKRLKDGTERSYTYCHCSGRRKDYHCSQKSIFTREHEISKQIAEHLSMITIAPNFYKLAIEALAEMNDDEILSQQAIVSSREKSIAIKKAEIQELTRMRYRGECPDDEFYSAEMKVLESELEKLHAARNSSEASARDWRVLANETFTFARYAKEDFESDNMDNKRRVLVQLGQNLVIEDGILRFTPNKYLTHIHHAYPELSKAHEAVGTDSDKRKNVAKNDAYSLWYTRYDSNVRPSVPKTDALIH